MEMKMAPRLTPDLYRLSLPQYLSALRELQPGVTIHKISSGHYQGHRTVDGIFCEQHSISSYPWHPNGFFDQITRTFSEGGRTKLMSISNKMNRLTALHRSVLRSQSQRAKVV